MIGKILLIVATVLVLHAAFSAYEYLSHLKALGRPGGPLPADITFETLMALFLGILGASLNAPALKEISWASEMKKSSIDEADARSGFANYNTRGRGLLVKFQGS